MQNFRKRFPSYIIAIVGISLLTIIMYNLQPEINTITVSLLLLLFILFTATFYGSKTAILASILAMLSLNFFFLPPIGTLSIYHSENWIALIAFLAVSLTAGQLSAKARKRAEEAEKLYNELQIAFKQASEAEALRQSEKLKSALLDAVTHDLRTPLTSIKASVTTLLELSKETNSDEELFKLEDAEKNEFLEIINEETDRLNSFIEHIVGLAKVEANALHFRKSRTEVEEIVNNAIERAKNQLKKFQLKINLPEDLPTIFVDANSISEVVYTFLDNAVKYSNESSEIRISAQISSAESIEISVEDKGRGISSENRSKIFDKFFRVNQDDIHTTSGGLGLGLAIARGIIESQGGKIWVEDGRGDFITRFVFQIPIGKAEQKF
jgi:two-component system sensor histidine kinase KdpD